MYGLIADESFRCVYCVDKVERYKNSHRVDHVVDNNYLSKLNWMLSDKQFPSTFFIHSTDLLIETIYVFGKIDARVKYLNVVLFAQ